jgi:hypothetical protein
LTMQKGQQSMRSTPQPPQHVAMPKGLQGEQFTTSTTQRLIRHTCQAERGKADLPGSIELQPLDIGAALRAELFHTKHSSLLKSYVVQPHRPSNPPHSRFELGVPRHIIQHETAVLALVLARTAHLFAQNISQSICGTDRRQSQNTMVAFSQNARPDSYVKCMIDGVVATNPNRNQQRRHKIVATNCKPTRN